jgi:NDP-sugar pyrophosphorylase family protein
MVSIEREFFPAVIADGIPSFGWSEPAYWRDIGNPAAYHAAQIDLLGGRVATSLAPAGESQRGSWIHPTASTAAARIEPPSVVGAGASLGPGAKVGPYAVIGPGCAIGAGARVQRAVLWEDVRVGDGAILRDCVVGAGATIGDRAEVGDGVVLEAGALVPAGEARRGDAPAG